MRRSRWDGAQVETSDNDRSVRSIVDRETRCSMIDRRSIRAAMAVRSIVERSIVIDPGRFDKKKFSNRACDLLTREDRHAIDSADMVARIFDCDHPNRCPTQFDPLLDSKGKRSPFFFLSSQTQSVAESAVTSCNSLR
jgi:hypothetical protein